MIIKVPNSAYYKYHTEGTKEHYYSWNYSSLGNILNRFFPSVKIYKSKRYAVEIRTFNRIKRTWFYVKWFFWHFLEPYLELTAICRKDPLVSKEALGVRTMD